VKKNKNELEVLSVEAQRLFHLIHAFPTRTGDLLERIQILTRKYRKGTENDSKGKRRDTKGNEK